MTKYYLRKLNETTCTVKEVYVGESIPGWTFALAMYDEDDIYDLEDWILVITRDYWRIFTDKNQELTLEQLLKVIIDRRSDQPNSPSTNAVPGPNGLLRRPETPYSVGVTHGSGTWDMVLQP